ncbi:TIGR01212 family radical SAM protein [Desulfitobacterium sp. LBE]|uniref:TIGR01212 family radical SAM protein n=1 Tax=Desulfitobacterium sp. LBE TaxID=884086 RepID=UPI0011A0E25E|nr:TIGR01212 family radical SAM protein [Desulfitobacterium sp. LBE]
MGGNTKLSYGRQEKSNFNWQNGDKRYYTLNQHLRHFFGDKVFKVSLDAGFTCPNRDGRVGQGGCIYCSARGSGDFAGQAEKSIHEQFCEIKEVMNRKWSSARYLAYFQAYTNTYAPLKRLQEVYEQALAEEGVVGLSIATRPDCLPAEVLDYLEELNQRTYLWVELGLQSIHDRTMEWVGRGHTFEDFLQGLDKLRRRNIRVCTHMIYGLPGETLEDMFGSAQTLAKLDVQGVKLHLLHVLKGTPLADIYEQSPFPLLSQDEYIHLICDTLEILPAQTVIHRLTGDAPRKDLLAPLWSLKKWEILNAIDRELERRGTWQGKKAQNKAADTTHSI